MLSTISSARTPTQSIRSSSVVTEPEPAHHLLVQKSHHVIFWLPPPTGSHVLLTPQVLPSCTWPPPVSHDSRSLAATQLFPVVLQQNGRFGSGSRLPHLSWMTVSVFACAMPILICSSASPWQLELVPPSSAHFSKSFSRERRYLMPALPMAFWQSFSPVSPRSR